MLAWLKSYLGNQAKFSSYLFSNFFSSSSLALCSADKFN